MKRSLILAVVLFPLLGLAALLHTARLQASPPQSGGVTFTVNSTIDATDANPGDGVCETAVGNGVCTLRAAVQETNALAGMDTIFVPAGIYVLTIAGMGENNASTGDLDVIDHTTINGISSDSTIIDANSLDRVIDIIGAETQMAIHNITLQNGAMESMGGGIKNYGILSLSNSHIFSNTSTWQGGGIFSNNLLTITNSAVTSNHADFGGGIYASLAYISNTEVLSNTGTSGGGISLLGSSNPLVESTLLNSNISYNYASFGSAGIHNAGQAIIEKTLVTHNHRGFPCKFCGESSGITNFGVLYLVESTVSHNTIEPSGRGASGIGSVLGITYIERSVISHNGTSPAIEVLGNPSEGSATIVNSTISHNESYGVFAADNITITNSTIFSNTLFGLGFYPDTVAIYNSIIAYNEPDNCNGFSGGVITSLGYNLDSGVSCGLVGTGDLSNQNPLLGPLQNNGGATLTHALLAGSPAIDGGGSEGCPSTDQRGVARPQGSSCDIGAYEFVMELTAVPDTITTTQNIPVLIDVLANDIPGDNGGPLLDSVGEPANGTAVITNSLVLYTPNLDFSGIDTFTYTITDGVVTDTAVVTVTVLPLIAPTAIDDIAETNQNEPILINVLANDLPGSSGDLVLDSVGAPMSGTAVITGSLILYTPTPDFVGTDTFTYTITDGVLTDTAVVTVTVLPVDTQTFIYLPVVLKP